MRNIKGFQPITLVDYPDKVAAIIFLGGCNFKCSFCHNPDLVLHPGKICSIDKETVLDYLNKRKNLLDGVVITGGEPCLTEEVIELIKSIKCIGLKVKLDTNGTRPEVLEKSLPFVDYIAMDIKSSPERYSEACGVSVRMDKIKKSVELIRKSGKDYEFRTTMVGEYIDEKAISDICDWLDGSKRYTLQQFNKKGHMVDDTIKDSRLFSRQELHAFAETCRPHFDHVEIRNI